MLQYFLSVYLSFLTISQESLPQLFKNKICLITQAEIKKDMVLLLQSCLSRFLQPGCYEYIALQVMPFI